LDKAVNGLNPTADPSTLVNVILPVPVLLLVVVVEIADATAISNGSVIDKLMLLASGAGVPVG
jgi:hypothetical protein